MRAVTADDSALIQWRFENGTVGGIKLDIYGHGSKDKNRKELAFLCEKGTLYIVRSQSHLPLFFAPNFIYTS